MMRIEGSEGGILEVDEFIKKAITRRV
jgi:hypothetical protein